MKIIALIYLLGWTLWLCGIIGSQVLQKHLDKEQFVSLLRSNAAKLDSETEAKFSLLGINHFISVGLRFVAGPLLALLILAT